MLLLVIKITSAILLTVKHFPLVDNNYLLLWSENRTFFYSSFTDTIKIWCFHHFQPPESTSSKAVCKNDSMLGLSLDVNSQIKIQIFNLCSIYPSRFHVSCRFLGHRQRVVCLLWVIMELQLNLCYLKGFLFAVWAPQIQSHLIPFDSRAGRCSMANISKTWQVTKNPDS